MLNEIKDNETLTGEHYSAIRSDGLSFLHCVRESASMPELVIQVDRLFGTALAARKSPLESLIDSATGRQEADFQTFLRFIWNYVFIRTPLATE